MGRGPEDPGEFGLDGPGGLVAHRRRGRCRGRVSLCEELAGGMVGTFWAAGWAAGAVEGAAAGVAAGCVPWPAPGTTWPLGTGMSACFWGSIR